MLAAGDGVQRDPASQTRDIIAKMDAVLAKAGLARRDVRDLLVYVTDVDAGKAALAECHAAFGASVSASVVRSGLAAAGGRVEIMSYAEHE